jgi:hypothetical protein
MKKLNPIPYFLNTERTPLVDQLLEIVKERDDHIHDLENEIARLKKLPSKPQFDKTHANKNKKSSFVKRPGSTKASKTNILPIHSTHIIRLENKPLNSRFKGYRKFIVQDISIQLSNKMFKCERWQKEDGTYIQASIPKEYQGNHFGPYLRSYILHQVYNQGVTRNLVLS